MKESKAPRSSNYFKKGMAFLTRKRDFTTTQLIAYGFLGAILLGSILLTLPISAANGKATPYIDALFTSTTSICVTGLTTVNTLTHWSIFGQIVITFLMQFGGLGIVTITTTILLALRKRITLKERLLIQDAYNLDTLKGMVRLTIRILKGTLFIEGIGACLYAIQYVPEYGLIAGIGKSIFNAISAFCNAGMDLVGGSSLLPYQTNILINVTTMLLIIIGGIGYPVWWDILRISKERIKRKMTLRQMWRRLELHTKLVLTVTLVLIITGAVAILALEYNNPATIGNLNPGQKVMASTFQSVTTRTAGFLTIPQEKMTNASSAVCILLMFIGGSPSGTAGGIKTVTICVILLSVFSTIKGKQDAEIFKRKITDSYVKKAVAIFGLSFGFLLLATIALCMVEDAPFLDLLYETTSAIATVGLTRNVTGGLGTIGKLIIIITMYLGRIGPITLALAFNTRKKVSGRSLPAEKILVG
ncbi:potassium uptake protein, integral membrane component, KtrB [Lachnospiraceae bacterium KM106-2]|nr:potassium uptake protein, integral membrane component, KtrB [Lachnospiraceae bacterium KM106-2]